MDPKRFDALTQALAAAVDRRRALKAALAGVLSGAAAARGLAGAGAESKTCRAEACAVGTAGDAFCQELGGHGCGCAIAEVAAQDGTLDGRCETGPGPCVPTTCAELGAECGEQPDGCDGTIPCGECPAGSTCDNGICFPDECVPETRDEACRGVQCGPASDGCGSEYDCGRCPRGERCLGNRCRPDRPEPDRCPGRGLAGQPCGGRCKCRGGRRCDNGRCCEPFGDGSVHCTSDGDCCPGLTCARKAGGRHKTCLRRPIGRAAIPAA